jgi:hypothetical protein
LIEGRRYEFGISGLLFKRNLLFYDRETGSLWSQLLSEAVTGPLAGKRLVVLPAENTTWRAWKAAHSETRVLSFVTGYARDYKQDPYAEYLFPRNPALLVSVVGRMKIYPFSALKKAQSPVIDHIGGHEVSILYDRSNKTARIADQRSEVTAFVSFLDDLKAFFPEAEIYRAPRR